MPVTVLDLLTYAGHRASLESADVEFVHGDVCDARLLAALVPGHDLVVNFAAESHVDTSIADGAAFARTNVLGVETLMRACADARVPSVVQVSTDEVYGSVEAGSCSEDAPLAPSSPYAATKASGDLIALAYHRTHGVPVRITRCANNYGPYQHPEKLIPRFATNLLTGRPLPLYGDGGNVREWIHVDDHCRALRLVASRGAPGEVYNVAGTTALTNRELTERLLKALDADWSMVEQVSDRPGHDRRYSLSDAKLRALGYRPRVAFEDGFPETIRWYAEHESWWRPLTGP